MINNVELLRLCYFFHYCYHDNMPMEQVPLESKLNIEIVRIIWCTFHQGNKPIRVCIDIPNFLITALKPGLCALVRTASIRRFKRVPTIYVFIRNRKIVKIFHPKMFIFSVQIFQCI